MKLPVFLTIVAAILVGASITNSPASPTPVVDQLAPVVIDNTPSVAPVIDKPEVPASEPEATPLEIPELPELPAEDTTESQVSAPNCVDGSCAPQRSGFRVVQQVQSAQVFQGRWFPGKRLLRGR
jgi:hypothetical protein